MPSSSSADAGREHSYDEPDYPLRARPLLIALAVEPDSGDHVRLSAAEKRKVRPRCAHATSLKKRKVRPRSCPGAPEIPFMLRC